MMDVEQLLFDLHVYSGSSYEYFLTRNAVSLLIVCGEDWEPTLKILQREVAKLRECTYDTFLYHRNKASQLAWDRNRPLSETYAHRNLEKVPTVKVFIDILYTYILRSEQSHNKPDVIIVPEENETMQPSYFHAASD